MIDLGRASMPRSHCRTPNEVIRVMPETLMTTVLASPRLPKPAKCSSTRPATFTSAASPEVMTSTPALGRVIAVPVGFGSRGIVSISFSIWFGSYFELETIVTDLLTVSLLDSSSASLQNRRLPMSLKNR